MKKFVRNKALSLLINLNVHQNGNQEKKSFAKKSNNFILFKKSLFLKCHLEMIETREEKSPYSSTFRSFRIKPDFPV